MFTDDQILELRSHFPILCNKTYLYSCSQGALCDEVEAGFAEYVRSWRESAAPWDDWLPKYEEVRTAFARFINAKPEEVAVITSASAGINPIANALSFGDRNKIVMGQFEFPTVGHIWLAQRARGAEVQFLPGVNDTIPMEYYEQAIDRHTRIVPLTQVSFLNGFRSDVATVTRIAHERGALVFLDAYQDCGTRPIDVRALGVDFLVTGTLKYMLGPPGLAFLYVREDLIPELNPPITSWLAQSDVSAFNPQVLAPALTARRFEGGTPPIPNIYAALAALKFLSRIGLENVAAQIQTLAQAFLRGTRDLRMQAKTPADSVGPLVVLRAKDPAAILNKLAERKIITSTRHDGVRFSFHVYNTIDDVNAALTILEDNLELMMRV